MSISKSVFNFVIGRDTKKPNHGDPVREVFETVVFVVVLVLMLKLFVAEAFVIPTGSMASTLYGDQFTATCPACTHQFPMTASVRQNGPRHVALMAICQNCGHMFEPKNSRDFNSGDRVLVAKYDYHLRSPKRFDVPVFKYPEEPFKEYSAMNYIKRLVGLPGETIAIYNGDLYRTDKLTYDQFPKPADPNDLWRREYMYSNAYVGRNSEYAATEFKNNTGGFEIIRKTPKDIMTVRRLVFDLDRQPSNLHGIYRTRWHPMHAQTGWTMEEKGFTHKGTDTTWMRYAHIQSGWTDPSKIAMPMLIQDDLSYNLDSHGGDMPARGTNWVPDLLVECQADFKSNDAQLILELTKAGSQYQATFAGGKLSLSVTSPGATEPTLLTQRETKITTGRHHLRFANFDSRLTVWIDHRPIDLGTEGDYPPPDRKAFKDETADKEQPARIGAKGDVQCSQVQLWRDIFYTSNDNGNRLQTHYVQPGHYFCMGDNSTSSSDGRTWGLVPQRLILGRAAVIYWPISRWRVIE